MFKTRYCQGKHQRFFLILSLFSFIVIVQPVSVFALSEQWSSEFIVTSNSFQLKYPGIAVNNRVLHVVWLNEHENTSEIEYTKSIDNGDTWQQMKKLAINSTLIDTPQITVNGESVHLVWKDFRTGYAEIFYKKSSDNGDTWSSDIQLTFNHSRTFDVFDLKLVSYHDTLHLVWKDYRNGSSEIYYKNSYDNGVTWQPDQRLSHDYSPSYSPSISLFQHTVYVTWDNWGDLTEIWGKRSDDNGKTWSNTTLLSSEQPAKNSWIISDRNTVHLVWQEENNGTWNIYYKNSRDAGRTWSDEQRLTFQARDCFSPKIMSVAETVYVFWQELRNGICVIAGRHSSDNGMTWSEEALLTDVNESAYDLNLASSGHTQFFIWQYSSDPNQICYKKKSETTPIITDITIDNSTFSTQHNLLIRIDGGDSLYDISALICKLEGKVRSGEYSPIQTILTGNNWEGTYHAAENSNDGQYTIRAKLITPEGKESQWYTTTTSVLLSDNSGNRAPGFEFFIILCSLGITIGLYLIIAKGGKS